MKEYKTTSERLDKIAAEKFKKTYEQCNREQRDIVFEQYKIECAI